MRQLKGKPQKETRKDKRERRKENVENKKNVTRVVLPVCGLLLALLVGFVLYSTNFKI